MFVENFVLNKTHIDYGLVVTKTKWKIDDFSKWIDEFQCKVIETIETNKL